jgi:hypothetical protein
MNTADGRSSRRHVTLFVPTLHAEGAECKVGDLPTRYRERNQGTSNIQRW